MSFDHVCDDLLWKYSIGVLEEPELGQVEEHLLICQDCRARLTEFDNSWGLHG
jgi:anti-sigma factor RsiW